MGMTFGAARPMSGGSLTEKNVNVRDVLVDGEVVGKLFGINPSPHNPVRPTAFRFIRMNGSDVKDFDRLSEARTWLGRSLAADTDPRLRPQTANLRSEQRMSKLQWTLHPAGERTRGGGAGDPWPTLKAESRHGGYFTFSAVYSKYGQHRLYLIKTDENGPVVNAGVHLGTSANVVEAMEKAQAFEDTELPSGD